MKIIISIIVITLSILFLFDIGGSDKNIEDETSAIQDQSLGADTSSDQSNKTFGDADNLSDQDKAPAIQDQSVEADTSSNQKNKTSEDTDHLSGRDNRYFGDTDAPYAQDDSSYANSGSSYGQGYSTYGNAGSSYGQDDSTYGNAGSSYDQDDSTYGDADSSYGREDSTRGNTGSLYGQQNSSNGNTKTKNKQADPASEDTNDSENSDNSENSANVNYQRVYDNGIVWYGDIGTLLVQYQSSVSETTGLGFRVHFDHSSMKVNSVTSYPVDAIISTTPKSLMPDTDNRDNDAATNYFLPFAWASLYGQWPQANQINLATIEFEKVHGSSANYRIHYSPISVPAGFQFIQ